VTPPPDPPDRIELRGLRVMAVHGVLPEERERPQPFEIDLDLGAITDAAAAALAGPPANLLEHLADRVVDAVFSQSGPRLAAVSVTVRKLEPPVGPRLASAGVTIRRRRGPG
jgi:7,8-dihydroneopterin aldolase/epimerase/oxygenase